MASSFSILHLIPVALGGAAIWLLLPQLRRRPLVIGIATGAAGILALGLAYVRWTGTTAHDVLFCIYGGLAVVAAACMITQRNPVYSALWFALVILSTCGLYLLAAAPFLAAATVIVYAGAIIVTFLFVIMLAQQQGLAFYDRTSREPLLATLGGFLLLGALLYAIFQAFPAEPPGGAPGMLDALATRRANCQAVRKQLDIAAELLREGQSTEIVGKVLYEDPKKAETAVGARLWVELDALPSESRAPLRAEVERLGAQLGVAQAAGDRQAMLASVAALRDLAERIQARVAGSELSQAAEGLPLGTVAGLGRSLFTDYLIALELAGTALLVATIGAILIAGRRREGLT